MFERLPGGSEAHLARNDAWWPGRGPRLLFILRLAPSVTADLDSVIQSAGIKTALGARLFPPALWHQSVSDRYADRPELRERLLAAGGRVRARGLTVELDELKVARNKHGKFNVEARQRSACPELVALVDAVNYAVAQQGLPKGKGHSAHVTLSYNFEGGLKTQPMIPVQWAADALELVVGGGQPYTYTTLGRWMLDPAAPPVSQPGLF